MKIVVRENERLPLLPLFSFDAAMLLVLLRLGSILFSYRKRELRVVA